jgi:hypothetical protein
MKLLHKLGEQLADGANGVFLAAFVAEALRELSVDLCQGNAFIYRAGAWELARVSGHSFRGGTSVPADEPVVYYSSFC